MLVAGSEEGLICACAGLCRYSEVLDTSASGRCTNGYEVRVCLTDARFIHPAWGSTIPTNQCSTRVQISCSWPESRCRWSLSSLESGSMPPLIPPAPGRNTAVLYIVYESVSRGGLLKRVLRKQRPDNMCLDRLASTFNRTLTLHERPRNPCPLSPPAYQSPPSQSAQDANARDRTRRRMGRAGEFDWSHLSVGARAGALPPKVRRNEHATVASPFRPLTALAPS